MEFNTEKFRESARAANWTDEAIDSYLASKNQSSQVNAVTGRPLGEAGSQAIDKSIAEDQAAAKKAEDEKSQAQKFFDWVRTPVGTATTAAVVLGGLEGGRRLLNRGRGDGGNPPNTPPGGGVRIDPTFDMTPPGDITDVTPKAPSAPAGGPAPAAQNLPKPTFPQGAIQQPVISGYGQQTMNAPTGVPNVAAPAAPVAPPADVAPQPVDPRQAALIRKAEAEAGIAEHKLQQLQLNAKVTPAGKPAGSVSETDLQMVQKSGEASADKMLRSQAAATTAVDNIAPAADPIQTTATPAEKQAAVDVVAEENKKVEAKKQAPAIEGKVGAAVEPPEGYIPSYMKGKPKKGGGFEYKNKQGADVIGQGGWHWYQGQMGPEAKAEWEKTYGKTNQSYDTVKADVASGKLKGPEVVEGKGGKFPRQANVPNYIKGSSSLGMAGTLAGLGLLGVAGSEKGREAMSRAASAISDLGVSPDIFAGKGEELGKLGKSYITAGNPNYIREIRAQLEVERDPNRRAILQEELQKAGGSGSSRGIAPPSAYLR